MQATRATTEYIAVHCTATPPSMEVDEDVIRKWHVERGWSDIGYNILILRDGVIQIGRPLDNRGAHVRGYNSRALGVCLVGGVDAEGKSKANYTQVQMESLLTTLEFCKKYAPGAHIQGHRDFPGVSKDCPCFDVRKWLEEEAPNLL